MPIVRELITKWGFDVDDKALDSAEKKLRSVQAVAESAVKATGAALAAMVVPAAMVQDKVVDALTIAGKAGEELIETESELINKSLELSQELGIMATDVGASFYDVISAGNEVLTEEFDALAETGLKMAKVVKMEASDSIEALSDTVNGFGMAMTEADRAANVLFKTSFLAATNVPMLTEAMKEAGPISNTVGKEIEETSAIIAAYAKAGIKGAQAGTAYRSMMVKLSAPNKNAKEGLKNLNTTIFDTDGKMRKVTDIMRDLKAGTEGMTQAQINANLKMVAGEEGFAKMALLMNSNLDEIDEWEKSLKSAGGALDEAFDIKMNSAYEQGKLFLMGLMNIGAALGKHLLPPLTKVLKTVNELFTSVVKFLLNSPVLSRMIVMLTSIVFLVSSVVFGFVSWKLAVVGLTAAMKSLGIASNLVLLKWVAIGVLAVAAIAIIILAMNDLYNFLTGKGDSVLQHVVDNWDAVWGENLNIVERALKAIGDIFIKSLKGWQLLVQSFSEILANPWTFMYTVATTILTELYDKFLQLSGFMAKTLNKTLNIVGLGADEEDFNKGVDIIRKESVGKLSGTFSDNIDNILAAESARNSINSAPVSSSTINTVNNKNSNKSEINISVDGSSSPKETAVEVGKVVSEIVNSSNNDFSDKVEY